MIDNGRVRQQTPCSAAEAEQLDTRSGQIVDTPAISPLAGVPDRLTARFGPVVIWLTLLGGRAMDPFVTLFGPEGKSRREPSRGEQLSRPRKSRGRACQLRTEG